MDGVGVQWAPPVIEERVTPSGPLRAELVEEHGRLRDRLAEVRAMVRRAPLREAKAVLMELLDAMGEHERSESDAAEETTLPGPERTP